MSVKTCQLCGKPLGRLRVGGDGEFCSREHRNQFRLRRGMDRLTEANKVAILMRRRETLRQVPPDLLLSRASQQPRPFSEALRRNSSTKEIILPTDLRIRNGLPASRARVFASRGPALVSYLRGPGDKPGLPRAATSLSVPHLALLGRVVVPIFPSHPKVAELSKPAAIEIEITPAAIETKTRPLSIPFRMRGRFRVELRRKARTSSARLRPRSVPVELDARPSPSTPAARNCLHPIPPPLIRIPDHTARLLAALPDPRPVTLLHPFTGIARSGLVCEMIWRAPQNVCQGLRIAGPRAPALNTATPKPVRITPAGDGVAQRLAAVSFVPADSKLSAAPASARVSLTVTRFEAAEERAARMEDNFITGLGQWAGETAAWSLDAAGVRPEGLALFEPSLGLSDYELEFLARIEQRALTFVFRAANLSNYHKVTIRSLEPRRHQLERAAVIGGLQEETSSIPLGADLRAGSAFTVKVRVRRNDFAISLDDEPVARFTDGRLPIGGIGFAGQKGERARIYYVRLVPSSGNLIVAPFRVRERVQ
jgi:hypothetical protein